MMDDDERRRLVKNILRILNERKMRATYGAVACILETHPLSVGRRYLKEPRPEASWVVAKTGKGKGKPTGYEDSDIHPELCSDPRIIKSCCKLRKWLNLPPATEHRDGCACYRRTEE